MLGRLLLKCRLHKNTPGAARPSRVQEQTTAPMLLPRNIWHAHSKIWVSVACERYCRARTEPRPLDMARRARHVARHQAILRQLYSTHLLF